MTLEELAEKTAGNITRLRDCAWDGPSDGSAQEDWGTVGAKARTSDGHNRRSFQRRVEALAPFPDDAEVHHFRHWALGWVDHLMVRVYDKDRKLTPAFKRAARWMRKEME